MKRGSKKSRVTSTSEQFELAFAGSNLQVTAEVGTTVTVKTVPAKKDPISALTEKINALTDQLLQAQPTSQETLLEKLEVTPKVLVDLLIKAQATCTNEELHTGLYEGLTRGLDMRSLSSLVHGVQFHQLNSANRELALLKTRRARRSR